MTILMVMRPETWLETVLGSPYQIRLFRVLARDPSKSWTERGAAAEAGMPQSTANLAFQRLAATGLLEVRRVGRSNVVRLHKEYEVAQRLIDLFQAEAATLDRALGAAIKKLPSGVAVYLFGSTARNQAGPASDIDVFLMAPDPETAEAAANILRTAVRRVLPAPIQIVALDRAASRDSRYKKLLDNIRREGRQVSPTSLDEVVR